MVFESRRVERSRMTYPGKDYAETLRPPQHYRELLKQNRCFTNLGQGAHFAGVFEDHLGQACVRFGGVDPDVLQKFKVEFNSNGVLDLPGPRFPQKLQIGMNEAKVCRFLNIFSSGMQTLLDRHPETIVASFLGSDHKILENDIWENMRFLHQSMMGARMDVKAVRITGKNKDLPDPDNEQASLDFFNANLRRDLERGKDYNNKLQECGIDEITIWYARPS